MGVGGELGGFWGGGKREGGRQVFLQSTPRDKGERNKIRERQKEEISSTGAFRQPWAEGTVTQERGREHHYEEIN